MRCADAGDDKAGSQQHRHQYDCARLADAVTTNAGQRERDQRTELRPTAGSSQAGPGSPAGRRGTADARGPAGEGKAVHDEDRVDAERCLAKLCRWGRERVRQGRAARLSLPADLSVLDVISPGGESSQEGLAATVTPSTGIRAPLQSQRSDERVDSAWRHSMTRLTSRLASPWILAPGGGATRSRRTTPQRRLRCARSLRSSLAVGIHGPQVTAERVQIHVEVRQQINLVDQDEVS